MQTVKVIQKQKQEILGVTNLYKSYNEGKNNEVKVLKGFDFSITAGQMVAIMGPSGCGKTTLLNLIGGLDNKTSGSIMIGDYDISQFSDKELTAFRRENIGFIFQLFNLFEDQTSLENVTLPLLLQGVSVSDSLERARLILQEVGLGDRLDEKPSKLSGGEQQKVAISRALVTNPSLILADEPTGDLDISSSDDIMDLFRRMKTENPEMAIVIVTHSQRIANQCDRIIRIQDGLLSSDLEVM